MKELIKEARELATEINTARQEGRSPAASVTARLVVLSALIIAAKKQPPVFSEYAKREGV